MFKGIKKVNRISRKKKFTVIIAMLAMCIIAVVCIFSLANGKTDNGGSGGSGARDAETASAGEQAENADSGAGSGSDSADKAAKEAAENDGDTADDGSSANKSKGSDRVYSYNGSTENAPFSLAAYDSAIEAGSGVIVLPFVVSADGTAYVSDDDYAGNLAGYEGYFSGMTDSQIDEIKTKAGGRVLKLGDVFREYGKDVRYVIEIKYTSGRNISAFKDIVKEYGYEDIVTAACMYHDTLDSLESDFPDMPKLYLCQDQAGINVACGLSNIDIVCADKSVMTESNCKLVHDSGKKFSARTLDTEEEIKSAINIGVDSYITNEAETAMKLE